MPVCEPHAVEEAIIGTVGGSTELMVERAWAVSGLHCAACAEQLRDEIRRIPGVEDARVGYAAALAVVQALEAVQAALPERLRKAGYRLAPMEATSAAALRTQESRQLLWRLFVAGFCMMQVMMLAAPTYFTASSDIPPDLRQLLHWGSWMLSWPVVLFSSQPFLVGAWRSLKRGQLGMDVPVALGILVTFGVSTLAMYDPKGAWGGDVFFDSLTMFVAFLLGGRWFELKARHAAAAELAALVAAPTVVVQRELPSGGVEQVALPEVRVGDVLCVALGEPVPVDALLLEGQTLVDEALLTGESEPVARRAGEALVGGSLNVGSPVRLRALSTAGGGRSAQLARRLQVALTERPHAEALADRWAGRFLGAVLVLAFVAGVLWSLVDPHRTVAVICAVLIVTCPCAFALAQPAARVASYRALARQGLLLQRLPALEALTRVRRVWLDKTGTLTRPEARPHALSPQGMRHLGRAVALASWSRHPMAQAVARCAPGEQGWRWRDVQELPGEGLRGRDAEGCWWRLGRGRDGLCFGREGGVDELRFDAEDTAQPFVARLLTDLEGLGLRVGMLSGDQPERVGAVARQIGLKEAFGGCTPEEKQARVVADQAQGISVLMVGDGVNDAPVLAQADVSLAVSGASALAARAADVLLVRGELSVLPSLIRQARRTQTITRQNLVWAAAYNGLAVPLALAGYLPPWAAGLGMATSSLLVVGNSLRLVRA